MSGRRLALAVAAALAAAGVGAALWLRPAGALPTENLPSELAGRVNPRAGDLAAVSEGVALFHDNCVSCHGERADGHGAAAAGLTPPPANFRGTDVLARHSDAYLFYRLTEGKPGTAMPSFRGALAERERWAVIAYLRSLTPDPAPTR
ncbi:MAG TPA: cytochrome c [Candidatus Binatia bacterium]